MDFRRSKTFQNIKSAFSGECQANMAYTFYASQAEKEGLQPLAILLSETASNEKEHAEVLFKKINSGGNNELPNAIEGLSRAILGERYEAIEKYKTFASIAKQEGFQEISDLFEKLRVIEENHMKRFEEIKSNLLQGVQYKSTTSIAWICMKCGNVEYGVAPPDKCPVCEHNGTFYRKSTMEERGIVK